MFLQKHFLNKHFKLNEGVRKRFFNLNTCSLGVFNVLVCAALSCLCVCVCGVMTAIRRPVELFHPSVSVLCHLTKALASKWPCKPQQITFHSFPQRGPISLTQ